MPETNAALQTLIDALYRKNFGRLVASLLYFSRDIDAGTAEDIVHDAFAAAWVHWEKEGTPRQPEGWLFTVCRNKALNKIKADKPVRALGEHEDFHGAEAAFSESVLDHDPSLQLLFACAHPELAPKTQLVITLKYVVNFKVETIARILGMTLDGVDKLLVRARQKIKQENILLHVPGATHLAARLNMVHKVLYLLFNEGYKSSQGKEMIREELCEEALLMTKGLLDHRLGNDDTLALYALMLFNAARLKARFGPAGELRDLEEQDRSLWNADLIDLGCYSLRQCNADTISSYHIEASIAYFHSAAKSFAETDWHSIRQLYQQLLLLNHNPFVELNYAIALYYSGEKQKAMTLLTVLQENPFMHQYHLLWATLGKLHLTEGKFEKAKLYFKKTLELTHFEAEKEFISRMIQKCG